ncbi:MAG: YcaQ family DNA glycosylase [Clostridia bacterium]|nr:YcaQ family DNA glycosylase [Clostridia bacterium]
MARIQLTREEACRFLLLKQGLLGKWRFSGKEGALAYVRQAGCIQFDPVDVCGRNADLTLQSRVRGYRKEMLSDLLYTSHALIDYPDKELAIWPVEDWPAFRNYRERSLAHAQRFPELPALEKETIAFIEQHGPVSSDTLPIEGKIHWHSSMHWSGNWGGLSEASRSCLEQLYTDGVLVIHHKAGTRKFYDLASRHIAQELLQAPWPFAGEAEYAAWRVRRRIGAVGLLWNRHSDALLGTYLDKGVRDKAFLDLLDAGSICEIQVADVRYPLYCLAEDLPLLSEAREKTHAFRVSFLAPLDPLLWDRKLIEALFGFAYSWEIYTPKEKRKYGYYVLPIVAGARFAGRIELAADSKEKTLTLRNLWWEPGIRQSRRLSDGLEAALERFLAFSESSTLKREDMMP